MTARRAEADSPDTVDGLARFLTSKDKVVIVAFVCSPSFAFAIQRLSMLHVVPVLRQSQCSLL